MYDIILVRSLIKIRLGYEIKFNDAYFVGQYIDLYQILRNNNLFTNKNIENKLDEFYRMSYRAFYNDFDNTFRKIDWEQEAKKLFDFLEINSIQVDKVDLLNVWILFLENYLNKTIDNDIYTKSIFSLNSVYSWGHLYPTSNIDVINAIEGKEDIESVEDLLSRLSTTCDSLEEDPDLMEPYDVSEYELIQETHKVLECLRSYVDANRSKSL